MSIFDRFFGRDAKTLFSQHNTQEIVYIDRVNSFKMEFLGKSNRVARCGESTLLVRRADDVILNGVYCRMLAVFEVETPANDPTTLERISAIHKFSISTAGDREGKRLDVEITDTAVYEAIDYLKTHVVFDERDIEEEAELEDFV